MKYLINPGDKVGWLTVLEKVSTPKGKSVGCPEEGMTLDREEACNDYRKENCRWVTKSFNSSHHG